MAASTSSTQSARNYYDQILPLARKYWPGIERSNHPPEDKVAAFCLKLIEALGRRTRAEFLTAEEIQQLETDYVKQEQDKAVVALYKAVRVAFCVNNPPPVLEGIPQAKAIAARAWFYANQDRLEKITYLCLEPHLMGDPNVSSVGKNGVSFIGKKDGEMRALRREHGIACIPKEIKLFPNLTCLDLSYNQIAHIPEDFPSFCPQKLEEICLFNNDIEVLPETNPWPHSLKNLNLRNNQLRQFPTRDQLPSSLEAFSIGGNKISGGIPADYENRAKKVYL